MSEDINFVFFVVRILYDIKRDKRLKTSCGRDEITN